jgi:hypothetical protein
MIHMLHKNRTEVYFYGEEKYFSRYSTFYFKRTPPDKRTSLYMYHSVIFFIEI